MRLLLLISFLTSLFAWGQKFDLKPQSQIVKIGEPLVIEAKLIFNKKVGRPEWPKIENGKKLHEKYELINVGKIDKKVNSNTEIWKQQFSVIMWDTGQYQMPPISVKIGADEFFSDAIFFEVISSQINTDKNPNDIAEIKDANWTFWDVFWFWLKRYWFFILLPLLIYLGYYFWKNRKSKIEISQNKEDYSPWEWAKKRITDLEEGEAWHQMETREYYFQLSDIFKEYLEDHLSIRALDRTSSQIRLKCRKEIWYKNVEADFKRFLQEADLAKFAKAKTSPAEAKKSLDFVKKITELTRYASNE